MKKLLVQSALMSLLVGFGSLESAARFAQLKASLEKAAGTLCPRLNELKSNCFEKQLKMLNMPEKTNQAARIIAGPDALFPHVGLYLKKGLQPLKLKNVHYVSRKQDFRVDFSRDLALTKEAQQHLVDVLESTGIKKRIFIRYESEECINASVLEKKGAVNLLLTTGFCRLLEQSLKECNSIATGEIGGNHPKTKSLFLDALIYHEMGHVFHNHSFSFAYKGYQMSMYTFLLLQLIALPLGSWGSIEALAAIVSCSHVAFCGLPFFALASRYEELEADSFLVTFKNRALLKGAVEFFGSDKVVKKHQKVLEELPPVILMSSHPASWERVVRFKRALKQLEQQEASKESDLKKQ